MWGVLWLWWFIGVQYLKENLKCNRLKKKKFNHYDFIKYIFFIQILFFRKFSKILLYLTYAFCCWNFVVFDKVFKKVSLRISLTSSPKKDPKKITQLNYLQKEPQKTAPKRILRKYHKKLTQTVIPNSIQKSTPKKYCSYSGAKLGSARYHAQSYCVYS